MMQCTAVDMDIQSAVKRPCSRKYACDQHVHGACNVLYALSTRAPAPVIRPDFHVHDRLVSSSTSQGGAVVGWLPHVHNFDFPGQGGSKVKSSQAPVSVRDCDIEIQGLESHKKRSFLVS